MQMSNEITLADLQPNECGEIVSLSHGDQLSSRLLTMGLYPGIKLRVVRNAPLRDPMEIEIDGTFLCLRRHESRLISVIRL